MATPKRTTNRGDSYTRITTALLELDGRHSGNDYICPAHDDNDPSLGVTQKNGKVLLFCSAGCTTKDVLASIGMTMANLNGLSKDPKLTAPKPPQALPSDDSVDTWATALQRLKTRRAYWTDERGISARTLMRYEIGWDASARKAGYPSGAFTFPYRDEDGKLLNLKKRWERSGKHEKTFQLINGHSTNVLWPADQLQKSWVVLCEGESDALRAIEEGLPAVTFITGAGGAEKAVRSCAPLLQGMHVVIAFDADTPGRKSARAIAEVLVRYAESVRIFDPFPKRSDGSDLSDWFDTQGHDAEEFRDQLGDLDPIEESFQYDVPSKTFLFPEGTFNPPRLGRAAEDASNLRRGPGNSLWRYQDGLYLPDGEEWLAGYVRDILQEDFREGRLREVKAWCKANFANVIPTQPSTEFINVQNGILYWQDATPRLVAHSPDIPTIMRIEAAWDPGADCPNLMKFLGTVIPEDCLSFFFEWTGYLLIPTSKFQRALMLEGPRDTGKSTLLFVIGTLLGNSASHHALQSICDDRFTPADLYGRLVNIYADIDSRSVESSGRFKAIVTGDAISAERKFGQPFSFRPFTRLIFSANEPPGTKDQSDAYYKRWLVLPMHHQVADKQQDANLEKRLTTDAELSGLLARSIEGLQRLTDRGRFIVPKPMQDAVQQYRRNTDTVVGWGEETIQLETKGRVRLSEAFENYTAWCDANNRRALGRQRFKEHALTAFPRLRTATRDGYPQLVGMRLAPGEPVIEVVPAGRHG